MGICANSKAIIEQRPTERPENVEYKAFQFDTTLVPEKQPERKKIFTNTIADRIVPQHTDIQSLSPYDQALHILQTQKKSHFIDEEFPPIKSSLSSENTFKSNKDIQWKRPSQFLQPGEIKLFDDIDPMDIKQGELGDCYFLSSLSALAEIPEQIQKLFRNQTFQENGLYGLYLCQNGILKEFVIDDNIPCQMQGGPIFSKSNGNELWVLLLEKAYAKIFGSYHKIESGLASCALKDLTGAPSEYFIRKGETLKDADICWDFIEKYDKLKYILTASSESNQQGVELDNGGGIVSQHCYAILDVQRVTDSRGVQDRIIKIRNPWGRKEWTRDWSDNSDRWTPQLRQQFKVEKKDDGLFWMSVNDFIKEFNQVCVCKFKQDYLYTATSLNVNQNDQITKKIMLMKVYEKTHAFISLTQKDKRSFQKGFQYSLARLIIGQLDDNTKEVLHYSGCAFDNERDIVIEKDFLPGNYALYIEVDWSQDMDRYLAISSYGSNAVQFSELKFPQDKEEQAIQNIFDGFLRAHERDTDEEKVKEIAPGIRRISGVVGGYLYYWYQNSTTKSTLQEVIQLENVKYLQICPPFTQISPVTVTCRPMNTIMLKYRVSKEGGGAFSYSLKCATQVLQAQTESDIIKQALTSPDEKNQRKIQNNPIQVYQYLVKFPAGLAFYYENKEKGRYHEEIKFEVTNLQGVDIDISRQIIIDLQPNQSKLIQLKSIDPSKGYGYKQSISYSLQ